MIAKLGSMAILCRGLPVLGELLCCWSHSCKACFSYVYPSAAMTGSPRSSCSKNRYPTSQQDLCTVSQRAVNVLAQINSMATMLPCYTQDTKNMTAQVKIISSRLPHRLRKYKPTGHLLSRCCWALVLIQVLEIHVVTCEATA